MAQDINFTMFNSAPLFINPANTGDFRGDWRIAGNYRNQWSATAEPFKTASVSIDKHLYLFKQKMGVGVFALNDNSGISGLNYNKFYGSLAYERVFNNNYFRAGLQAGMAFGSVNDWTVWDNSTGTFTLPSGEQGTGESSSYVDVNFGLTWKRNIGIFEPKAGIALSHINSPTKSFFGGDDKEGLKISFHSNVNIKLNSKIYLEPEILYTTKDKANHTIAGSKVGYNMAGNSSPVKNIWGGLYLRNGVLNGIDALVLHAGTTIHRLDINVSYDYNISDLSRVGGSTGTFELAFIYRTLSTVLNSYSIPCERY